MASRKSEIKITICCLLAAASLGGVYACTGKNTGDKKAASRPVILFAVDGLEWHILQPLLAEGKLPIIKRLIENGSAGYLETMDPTFSAVIWTTVATGKIPQKHGILNFVYKTGGTEGQTGYRYYTSGHRKTKAFWNILSDYERSVYCIGWWLTYPAEKINGIMISQTNTLGVLENPQEGMMKGAFLKGIEGQVYPPDHQNTVMDILEEVDGSLDSITVSMFGEMPNPPGEFEKKIWKESLWAFRADATYIKAARMLLEKKEHFDLMALYIGGTDVVAHRFWRYAHPEQFDNPPDKSQIENYAHIIEKEYEFVDRTIGELLQLAPADASVIIVSDHGMHAENKTQVFNTADPAWLRSSGHHLDAPPGVIITCGYGIKHQALQIGEISPAEIPTIGSVTDITPTILSLLGIPVGKDMHGVPLRGLIDPIVLSKFPIEYVDTHDTKKWLASRSARIREAIDQEERIEQLRSLGYIK